MIVMTLSILFFTSIIYGFYRAIIIIRKTEKNEEDMRDVQRKIDKFLKGTA